MSDIIFYEPRFKTALCRLCQNGVVVRNKKPNIDHFRHRPHFLKGVALQRVQQYLSSLELVEFDEISYPSHNEEPVAAVPCLPVHHAFECEYCPHPFSISAKNSRVHVSQQHRIVSGPSNRGLRSCLVQTLFRKTDCLRYFKVRPIDPQTVPLNTHGDHFDGRAFSAIQTQLLQDIDLAEQAQFNRVPAFDEHKSSIIPWVRSCGFDRHYQGFDQKAIRQSYQQPSSSPDEDEEAILIGHVASRAKALLEETWSWCVDGPQCRLTRPMAVMLSQFWTEASIHSKGFRANISEAARKEYFQLWAGCIIYFWKVSTKRALTRPSTLIPDRSVPYFRKFRASCP